MPLPFMTNRLFPFNAAQRGTGHIVEDTVQSYAAAMSKPCLWYSIHVRRTAGKLRAGDQTEPSNGLSFALYRLVTYRVCLLYVCVHVGHHVVGYVCVYIYQEGHFLPRFCCAMWILLTKLYDDCFKSNKRRHGQSPVISSDVTLWVVVLQYLTAAPNVIC